MTTKCRWQVRECVLLNHSRRNDSVFVLSTAFPSGDKQMSLGDRQQQWGRTCLCDDMCVCVCVWISCVPTWMFVWSLKCVWVFTADDQSLPPSLLAERRGAVNLRWLEATGKLNELSKPGQPPSLWQNASMLCAGQGAITRGHGRCLSFT